MGKVADKKLLKKLLKELRERYKIATQADHYNRQRSLEDMRFVHEPGAQWDLLTKKERGERPCLEFNKLRTHDQARGQ